MINAGPIALDSDVIHAEVNAQGIVQVTMADTQSRNMFSDAFTDGLIALFQHVEQHPAYKVVVLTGFDNYSRVAALKKAWWRSSKGKSNLPTPTFTS